MSHTKKNSNRYDLHMHSRFSDGDLSVEELLLKAKAAYLSGLSITDHDTLDAYPFAFVEGKKLDLKILSGIEISCLHQNKSVHVLGYAFSIQNAPLFSFIKNCQKMRYQRNLLILEKLKENNIEISAQEVTETFKKRLDVCGRPHFAHLMVEKKICKSVQEAFNLYLGDGKKCYATGYRPSVEEAIEILHQAHAFAIIAHPHLIHDETLIQDILKMPFDGLEAYYAKLLPHQEKRWVQVAEERNWLMTGGSDFHGQSKPINELGCSWVKDETFHTLFQRQKENENI